MSTKKSTKTQQTNTLPDWLKTPYQNAVTNATTLSTQPAISSGTQATIDAIRNQAGATTNVANGAIGNLSSMASGNFGNSALTQAANGSLIKSNPMVANGGLNLGYINGSGLNATANGTGGIDSFATNGNPVAVSSALNGFTGNGMLDTGYIGDSGLNATASGQYLTADSNPYIRGVAQQGADAAQAAINSQFGAAGRSNGSGLYAQLFGQGISDASNSVYAQNYANERQLQQSAQSQLLSANQSAREAALARQYGAAGSIFGAQNAAGENAATRAYGATESNLGRQQAAQGTLLSAQQAAREAALARQQSAYEAERQRQQQAAAGLLSSQLQASSQIPGLLSAISSGNAQALAAGQYADQADLLKAAQQAGLLSTLSSPFGVSSGKSTEKTSGLGNALSIYSGLMQSFGQAAAGA